MERSSILAHRGLFLGQSDKNSSKSLKRALDQGFGIETDIRDLDGKVVISHDPPKRRLPLPSLEWLLETLGSSPTVGRIALNIKSDGLAKYVESMIFAKGIQMERFFVFDMSIPDSLCYLKGAIPTYSRISDIEPVPAFLDKAKGIWVDDFDGSFPQVERAKEFVDQGIRVTIVSSELHQRDPLILWNKIIDYELHLSPLFELCTDFPLEAANRFSKA